MNKYINLNAQYGYDQNFNCVYHSLEDIMTNMDRLGIWQTVVEFTGANNTLERARRLVRDIQGFPNGSARIIPSFVLDTSVLFAKDGIEQLTQIMQQNQPCCVTLRPKASVYRLRMADLVLDRILEQCSVVFIDCRQLGIPYATDDIVYLAQRYPQMSFVIRQIMWTDYHTVVDMMSRAQNIYADNSLMHSRGALEVFAQFFGEDRVLFSTDVKANAGGPMAAITFADISDAAKEKIRYGNFINLFPNEEHRKKLSDNLKAIPNQVKNRFWTPFVERGIAPNVEIYDVHTHLGSSGNRWYLHAADIRDQVGAFLQDMKQLNVEKIVITPAGGKPDAIEANEEVKQALAGLDCFRGYLRYNPNIEKMHTKEYLDAMFADGFYIGLKTLPAYMGVDIRDARYEPMFRYAHEHGMPILIHTWDDSNASGSAENCADAAAKWPNAKVILGHTGGGLKGRLQCERIARDPKYKNVYFEFCGSFTTGRSWEDTLKSIDYQRVLYGTDACLHSMAWEMGRLLACDIPDAHLTAILGGNAKALFGF